jgi:hypothetical protein
MVRNVPQEAADFKAGVAIATQFGDDDGALQRLLCVH